MKKTTILITIIILLAACTPKPEQLAPYLQQTLTAWPTQTPYPTFTPPNTYTPYPTLTPRNTSTAIIKIVTQTYTPTPKFTPTLTLTPTLTFTLTKTIPPTPTLDPLKAPRNPGFYLIGINIAPGVWRNNGTGNKCYWAVTTKTGDIISNHYGMAGGTAYIPATGYQVEFGEHCGIWTWLSD